MRPELWRGAGANLVWAAHAACDDAWVAGDFADGTPAGPEPSNPAGSGGVRVAAAAFLRVYEPLDAARGSLAADEDGCLLTNVEFASREHRAALRAASALPPRPVADLDLVAGGQARESILLLAPAASDGVPRGCPADLTLRALLALDELRTQVRPIVLHAFMPAQVVAEAADRAERLQSRGSRVAHTRTSGWHVPLPWFAIFRPDQLVDDEPEAAPSALPARGVVRSVRYLASMSDARRCVARALAAVRRAPTGRLAASDFLPVADLEDLGRWLEEFHARSVVELDYGGLGDLLRAIGAAADDSVDAVSAAIAGLPTSPDEAISRLVAVRDRWAAVRGIEHAS